MKQIIIALIVILCSATTMTAKAMEKKQFENFKRTPILHDGRTKPMDSLARTALKNIHGKDTFNSKTASNWLYGVINNPKQAVQEKIFQLNNNEAKEFLTLNTEEKYFNALTLGEAFAKKSEAIEAILTENPESLSRTQNDVLELYAKTLFFTGLLEGRAIISAKDINPNRIEAETLYNKVKPYNWAIALYGLTLLLIIIATTKSTKLNPKLERTAFATTILASLIHAYAIASRIYILDRPPVGTLYESVIFVSLICAIIAIFSYLKRKQALHLAAGTTAALALLLIAPITAPQGETLGNLSAVLNTNFWLATHVLCITIGYGICIIAACTAHIALTKPSKTLHKNIYWLSISALLFTTVGTILGGIWADQSWGRFWGWDPKENGALLIVLWIIWIQHGKTAGKLSETAFLAGIAALNIIVALAWFGVNLLSTGLHSYGFTSGMATGLATFCALEIILIGFLWVYVAKMRKIKT